MVKLKGTVCVRWFFGLIKLYRIEKEDLKVFSCSHIINHEICEIVISRLLAYSPYAQREIMFLKITEK
jgi:hypothetical protein